MFLQSTCNSVSVFLFLLFGMIMVIKKKYSNQIKSVQGYYKNFGYNFITWFVYTTIKNVEETRITVDLFCQKYRVTHLSQNSKRYFLFA